MLQLKIGNIYVDYREIEIPVVWRSPLFSEGKGSYLFNFSLPASDALKLEFGHIHRPGRYGASSVKKPLSIKYGPLNFSGTATVTEADSQTYEVACPVDNGELAQLLKSMSMKDIDLGGVREATTGSISVDALSTDEISVDLINTTEVLNIPLPFDNILINADTLLDVTGNTITSDISGNLIIIFSLEVDKEWGYVYLEAFNGSTQLCHVILDTGNLFYPLEVPVSVGDVITWKVVAGPQNSNGANFLKFTVASGAKLQVFKQGILNQNNGLELYPNSDYACFPVENSKMFDKLEEDTYQIDHVSIKEIYNKYFPVINYYKDNHFPLVMLGESEEEPFIAFNLFNPFPYLAYVINQMAKGLGITIDNNVFEDTDLKQLVIFNLFAENSFITSELIQPKTGFNLQDHVPDIQVSKYWINLCKLLGIAFDFKAHTKTLRLKYLKDIATSVEFADFPGTIITEPVLRADPYNGYRLKQNTEGDEFISKYFKSIDGLTLKGSVNIVNQLSAITDQQPNDCYYVTSRKEFWYWNYDTELAIMNWIFFSKDFFFVKESIDEELGSNTYELATDINAIMDNGWPYTDNNICAPDGRFWLIPKSEQPGNFDGLPDVFKADFSKSLLFYHGLRFDNQEMLYPLASSDIYDYAGNPVTFEASSGYPAYTHGLSLRWDGENGLYEKRYKHWLNVLMRSRGFWRLRAHLTPLQLSQIDWFTWYKGPGYKFMIKEIRFNIRHDKISEAELDILIR